MKKKIQQWFIGLILLIGLITRFYKLSFPQVYIFDEVYHAFTAEAYAQNDPRGYEWWHQSPVENTAYEWLHPPAAKLFMALGILVFGNNSFGWRFFSAVFGVLNIYLIYLLAKKMFSLKVGLIAAFLLTFDNMFLTMSRIAMNDIFLTAFILAAIYFIFSWWQKNNHKNLFLTFIFTGLAMATKWPGVFLYFIIGFVLLINFLKKINKKKSWFNQFFKYWLAKIPLFFIPVFIYFLSYSQWWLQGHTWQQFKMLHQQIWWYQTGLEATHTYQSSALNWPLMLRPVWFWVDYQEDTIANIYNLGNPLIWWGGVLILPLVFWQAIVDTKQKQKFNLALLILAYFIFWLPWIFSPRIMFLHHYMPALIFLLILLAYFFNRVNKKIVALYLLFTLLSFSWFYPLNTGLTLPNNLMPYWFWLSSWK